MKALKRYMTLMAAGIAAMIAMPAQALTYSTRSVMSTGKWVKIATPADGIYELSYDRLRELGFREPEKVKVWGEGGVMYPMNFLNATTRERIIPDQMGQVSVWHNGGKLYFYGKGPDNISWKDESIYSIPGRFVNDGTNIYTTRGFYFLSDCGENVEVKAMPEVAGSGDPVSSGYAVFKHEVENTQGLAHSGQTFWGENFLSPDQRTWTFPYTAPMACTGSSGVLGVRFSALSRTSSQLVLSVDGKEAGTSSIDARLDEYVLVKLNNKEAFNISTPQPEGTVSITWNAASSDVWEAYLDYFMITYQRELEFAPQESQFGVHALISGTPYIKMPETGNTVCWDVTDPSAACMLPVDGNTANVDFGMRHLRYFRTDMTQYAPEIVGEVVNNDLRGNLIALNPELVIITTPEFLPRAEQLADFHRTYDNASIAVLTMDEVYNDFSSGRPDPMAYRSMLRMLYEQPASRLRGVLLYGPQLSDVRNLHTEEPRDALIVFQNPVTSPVQYSAAFTDIYGIFSDVLAKFIQTEQMSIAVAALPVLSDAEAERYYNKVVRYYFDDSRAYWMDRMLLTADDMDNNAHLGQVEDVSGIMQGLCDSTLVLDKRYFSEYGYPGIKQGIYDALKEGVACGLYIGHGSPRQIGKAAAMLNSADIRNFSNRSLPFMSWASCETTLYEIGTRGVSEHMVLSTDDGLIGMFGTVRTAFSGDNAECMRKLGTMMMQLPQSNGGVPVEYGELIRRAKNAVTGYEGKYKFHLMVDPMLRLMFPTMKMVMAENPSSSTPGEEVRYSGRITTPAGTASDFNGALVLKWYVPAYTAKTGSKVAGQVNPSQYVTYDSEVAATMAFEVSGGRFDFTTAVPVLMSQYAGEKVRVTLTAYDADRQIGATWSGNTVIDSSSVGKPDSDSEMPVIEVMEAEGAAPGYALPSDFTLRIEAADNVGLRIDEHSLDAPLRLFVDGRLEPGGVAAYAVMKDGARGMVIRYPMRNMTPGRHTVSVSVSDYSGNISSREYTFEVGSSAPADAPLLTETACRDEATFTMSAEVEATATAAMLVITDAMGRELYSAPWQESGMKWNLTDRRGERVQPGLYKAFIRFKDSRGVNAVTKGAYVPVLAVR